MTDTVLWLLVVIAILAVYGVSVSYFLVRIRHTNESSLEKHTTATTSDKPEEDSNTPQPDEGAQNEVKSKATHINNTFEKFVPKQFVDHFAIHGSLDLELGHADEDEVAILFCDIRGFTGLSEKMTPQELMQFLNTYFSRMNDPIHKNGGFIDKFIGDAIMALFDHPGGGAKQKASDAIKAALGLRHAITLYNKQVKNSEFEDINIGIGVHYGPVVIGTVGSYDRMDTTVIGDSVNIASRLEGLSPIYDVDIVVSEQLLEAALKDFDVEYRPLDWVKVKGRQAPIRIYEILNHLPIAQKRLKLASSEHIDAGLLFRIRQDWENALKQFELALNYCPDDSLALHHIHLCKKYQKLDLPEDWDGALALNQSIELG